MWKLAAEKVTYWAWYEWRQTGKQTRSEKEAIKPRGLGCYLHPSRITISCPNSCLAPQYSYSRVKYYTMWARIGWKRLNSSAMTQIDFLPSSDWAKQRKAPVMHCSMPPSSLPALSEFSSPTQKSLPQQVPSKRGLYKLWHIIVNHTQAKLVDAQLSPDLLLSLILLCKNKTCELLS